MKNEFQEVILHGKRLRRKARTVFLISLCLLFFSQTSLMALSSGSKNQVTLNLKNVSFEEVLWEIQKQTSLVFVYGEKDIKDIKIPELEAENKDVMQLISELVKNTDIEWKKVDGTIVFKKKKALPKIEKPSKSEQPEKIEISGKVLDDEGVPLPGATVLEKGTTNGISTEPDGSFTLKVAGTNSVLAISFVGFEPQEVKVGNKTTFEFILELAESSLDEVVAVGYGTTKKKDLTGSVTRLGKEVLQNAPVTATVQSVLQGRAAGVNVNIQSASPNSPVSVIIRGASSLSGDNQPLWVIDGVVQYGNSASGDISSALYNLNLEDVQSVDVLKDASATAIYGSRGANGVIIITTRKGVEGMKPQIEFSGKYSFQKIDDEKVSPMNAEEYIAFAKAGIREGIYSTGGLDYFTRQFIDQDKFNAKFGRSSHFTPELITEDLYNEDGFFDGNTDWWDIMTRTSMTKKYNLSIRGGSKSSSYFGSLTADDNEGIVVGSDRKNYSLRFNFESTIREALRFGINISSSYAVANKNDVGISNVLSYRPDLPPYDEDGNYYFYNYYTINPLWSLENKSESVAKRIDPNMFLEYKITKDLTFKVNGNISYGLTNEDEFRLADQGGNKTTRSLFTNENISLNLYSTLNYIKTIDDHYINALAGANRERFISQGFSASGQDFPDNKILINLGSAAEYNENAIESYKNANSLVSFFSRLNYIYKKRYHATFTARRDGSSRFGTDKRWGFFPSGAVAWTISEENFIKGNIPAITYLKLRASAGLTGSQNLGNYDWRSLMKQVTYNNDPGLAVDNLNNPNLQWENQMQYDVGLDYGLFDDRVRGTIGWYQKDVDNLLYADPVPLSSSKSTVIQNIGAIRNSGLEFDIKVEAIRKNDFKFILDFNMARNKGILKKLNSSDDSYGDNRTNFKVNVGGEFGDFYGFRYAGRFFQTKEEIISLQQRNSRGQIVYYRESSGHEAPGDLYILDIDGDGLVSPYYMENDYVNLGSSVPKFFGGFGTTCIWKGLYANATFNYSVGGKRYFQQESSITNLNTNNLPTYAQKSWTWSGEEGTLPRASFYGYGSNSILNEKYLHNSSYMRLSSLNISYRLPKKYFKKTLINTVELSLNGSNLFTITNYPGFDPQGNFSTDISAFSQMGIDYSTYPPARTYSFGLKVLLK